MGLVIVLVAVSVVIWLRTTPTPESWTDVDPQAWARRRIAQGMRDA